RPRGARLAVLSARVGRRRARPAAHRRGGARAPARTGEAAPHRLRVVSSGDARARRENSRRRARLSIARRARARYVPAHASRRGDGAVRGFTGALAIAGFGKRKGMAQEIERKFLVIGDAWRGLAVRRARMSQGYIASAERASVRVRIADGEAHLNIKVGGLEAVRQEFEYPIPVADGEALLAAAKGPLIEKTRHYVPFEGF